MPKAKDQQKEAAIYRAALQIVLTEGFSGLKIGQVAREAGVATGTVYLYFSNKQELISQLYLKLKRESAGAFLEGYDPEAPFMIGFETIWFNYFNTMLQRPEEMAFLEQYYRSPYLKEAVKEETDRLLAPIFELLEKGKQERLVADMDTPLLVAQLSGAMNELVRWQQTGSIAIDEETKQQAFQMAWNSIKR